MLRKVRDYFRSEEHTSELQSHSDLVCRLLLEKKKKHATRDTSSNARSPRVSLIPGHSSQCRARWLAAAGILSSLSGRSFYRAKCLPPDGAGRPQLPPGLRARVPYGAGFIGSATMLRFLQTHYVPRRPTAFLALGF